MDINTNETSVDVKVGTDEGFIYISKDFFQTFSLVSNTIINPTFCVIGVVCNCIGVSLLRRNSRNQQQSFYFYLQALLFTQTGTLLFGLIRSIPDYIKLNDFYLGNFVEEYTRPMCIYIEMVVKHSSTCILVSMSVERLLSLLKPFTVKLHWPSKHPRIIVATCFAINVVYLFAFAVSFQIESFTNSENRTEYIMTSKPQYATYFMASLYIETILLHFVSPIVILILNIAIPIAYWRILKENEIHFKSDVTRIQQLSHITIVMVTIMILFLLLSIPDLFGQTLGLINEDYSFEGKYRHVFYFFIAVSNVFTYLNAGCAAVVYIFASNRFWLLFKSKFCRCRQGLESSSPSTSITVSTTRMSGL